MRKLYAAPQKDGIETVYQCGFRCFGSWASRIEQWQEFIDTKPGQYIMKLEESISDAIRGMQWRVNNTPELMDRADYEKLDEWRNLLNQQEKDD